MWRLRQTLPFCFVSRANDRVQRKCYETVVGNLPAQRWQFGRLNHDTTWAFGFRNIHAFTSFWITSVPKEYVQSGETSIRSLKSQRDIVAIINAILGHTLLYSLLFALMHYSRLGIQRNHDFTEYASHELVEFWKYSFFLILRLRYAAPSVIRLCCGRTFKPSSGASIGVSTTLLQLAQNGRCNTLWVY
jgi:hypothetical protein